MIESNNLKGAAAKGLFWSATERFGAQGIQFVIGIFLTRILNTSDYGLLGMILIFMAVGQTLIDSGFGSALIWKKNPSQTDYSSVFYFNISVSFILYFLFFLIAPWVADFYDEPRLVDLIRVISLNFIILSFSLIQQTLLQKRVDFKLMAYVNFGGSIVAGIVALLLALNGFGVWSIVWQILIKSLITSLFLWVFSTWRPMPVFKFMVLKELFGYGSKLTVAGLIYTVFQNLYFNIIGKLFPIDSLGLYTRASQLQDFPVKTGVSIFNRVVFPVFATIQDDNERLKNAVRKTFRSMVFVMFPMIFILISIADHMIVVLLTEKWLPASGYFKLLCLTGLFYIFQIINYEILKTKGKLGWVLQLEIITKSLLVINIFITYRWGISAIIWGQIGVNFIAALASSIYVSKLIGYPVLQQMWDVSVYFIISITMFLVIAFLGGYFSYTWLSLILLLMAALFFYMLAGIIFKLEELNEIKTLIVNYIKKK